VILVTIGTMVPFDRLVQAADRWAAAHPEEEVFAQIGDAGVYEPKHMKWTRLVSPQEFAQLVDRSRLLVAHAGTGSFFLAAEKSRPIVMFPRRAAFKEHTTDHQVHTARWLRSKPGVYVAMTEDELPGAIADAMANSAVVAAVPPYAPDAFLARIREALVA
jgi:UDP-N-acetylglucosamine transferase subunit ALG13